jgi:hypothetical protein
MNSMKSHLEMLSSIRAKSRETVRKVISDHVFGDVTALPREDMLELRRVLSAAYPFDEKSGWEYKVWLQEIAFATGRKNELEFSPTYKRVYGYTQNDIMPAMRAWAKEQGLLKDTETASAS